MKSSGKRSTEVKLSLCKRTQSTSKLAKTNFFLRDAPEPVSLLKSSTLRMMPVRQRKVNNFIDRTDPHLTARLAHKKHRTVKLHTRHPHEELLLKRSDKMKLVFWNRDPALQGLPRVAVSADFILNQDAFWEGKAEEDSKNGRSTGEGLAREWRQLHKTSYVIWTIRRRSSLAKLQQLVGLFTLPLHAVFYIRRRRHYTVDFSPIQRELDKERLMKQAPANENPLPAVSEAPLCIFQTVKMNMKDVAGYHTYCSRVPVLLGNRAKIALVRMEGEPPGLEVVLRCLEKWRKAEGSGEEGKGKVQSARYRPVEVYRTTAVTNYIGSYLQRSIREEGELQVRAKDKPDADWEYDEDEIAGRIEEMKRKLIGQLIEDEGRQYQFEGGSSIYNFVGEMFKRNYRILYDNILQEMGSAHRRPPTAIPAAESSPQLQLSADYYELQAR